MQRCDKVNHKNILEIAGRGYNQPFSRNAPDPGAMHRPMSDATANERPAHGAAVPRISVIVLNWNGRDDTLQCLESLARLRYCNFEVIIVDNGSSDGSVPAIREAFPEWLVIETRANLGYAEGNNVGMRAALERGADFVLLLNNDTIVDSNLLTELSAAAVLRPDAGVFGAKIYHYSDRERIWYAGVRWDHKLLSFVVIKDDATYGEALATLPDTDYACGCALFVRREVLAKVGLLDAKFFLTYEETDFCYRARRDGFAVLYVPRAMVWHKISASFGGHESPLVSYFMTRNYLLWSERHLNTLELWTARLRILGQLRRKLIPPFPWKAMLRPGALVGTVRQFYWDLRYLWSDPSARALLWGTVHYVIRRFGEAPDFVRRLGKR
jgi:GT2 family glycosyltransferase